MKNGFLRDLKITDAICLAYCILQIIYVLVFGIALEFRSKILLVYLGCMAFSVACVLIRRKVNNPVVGFFTTLYPIILLIPFYEVSGYQIHTLFPHFFDRYILAFESLIFPVHPTIWLQRFFQPLIVEWMMFGYTIYLILLPITTGWLYITGKKVESEHMLLSLCIAFFVCYFFFSLFPVEGPRYVLASQYSQPLKGYFFGVFAKRLEASAMLHGGAFPSAHCAAATVMLLLSYKYERKLFWWILPVIITLYVATVYGRYHYPSDAVAGILVGIIAIQLSYPMLAAWDRILVSAGYRIRGRVEGNSRVPL